MTQLTGLAEAKLGPEAGLLIPCEEDAGSTEQEP